MPSDERVARALCDIDLHMLGGADGPRVNPELANWELYVIPARVAIATMRKQHIPSPTCWCTPAQDDQEPDVWLHNYQPTQHAALQGEDD
jgi:hypothetical protein